jgi:hypothetical protein
MVLMELLLQLFEEAVLFKNVDRIGSLLRCESTYDDCTSPFVVYHGNWAHTHFW